MRRVRFAEQLLSKVATPERAASIVGDLVETSPGETMFWVSVLRIGVSLLWKDVAAHPVRIAGLATAGAAMNIIMLAPFGAAWFLLLIALGLLGAALHRDMAIAATPMFVVMVVCAAIPAPFMTGRWIARRSAGKELAPCLVLSVLAYAVWGAFFLADGPRISVMNGLEGEWSTLGWLAVATLCLNAGAIQARTQAGSAWRWFERIPFEENWARRKRFWDLFIPADLQQQKVCDAFLFMALPLLFIRVPDAIPDSLFTALRIIITPALLFQAIFTRPLAWIRPSSRAAIWCGRALFFGLLALVVSTLFS